MKLEFSFVFIYEEDRNILRIVWQNSVPFLLHRFYIDLALLYVANGVLSDEWWLLQTVWSTWNKLKHYSLSLSLIFFL